MCVQFPFTYKSYYWSVFTIQSLFLFNVIDSENILVVSYEWMKANHRAAVERIAKFMEYDLTPSTVSSIVDQTTFDKMKVNKSTNYSWIDSFRFEKNTSFLRKGKVGDWKNYFTDEQSTRVDEEIKKTYEGTGLEFEYEWYKGTEQR